MNPMVSIVMPVYNSQEFLPQSVGTILSQTLPDFELILVDDGSKDTSLTMLQEYQKQDSRIQVIAQENQGSGVARNTGMAIARGKYILFLDSDDYFESNMLEVMVKKAEETRADVTICRATCFDHHTGEALPSDWLRKDKYLNRVKGRTTFEPVEMKDCLFQFTYGWAWDKVFRLDFVRERGMKFPDLRHSEDLVFVYTALACADTISLVSEKLVHYRLNRNKSLSSDKSNIEDMLKGVELLLSNLQTKTNFTSYKESYFFWKLDFELWILFRSDRSELSTNLYNSLKTKYLFDITRIIRSDLINTQTIYKLLLIFLVNYSNFLTICLCYRNIKQFFPKMQRSSKLKVLK